MNTKNIQYIDIGKMSKKEAYNVINSIRAAQGLPPITPYIFWWIPVGVGLLVLSLSLQALHLS